MPDDHDIRCHLFWNNLYGNQYPALIRRIELMIL